MTELKTAEEIAIITPLLLDQNRNILFVNDPTVNKKLTLPVCDVFSNEGFDAKHVAADYLRSELGINSADISYHQTVLIKDLEDKNYSNTMVLFVVNQGVSLIPRVIGEQIINYRWIPSTEVYKSDVSQMSLKSIAAWVQANSGTITDEANNKGDWKVSFIVLLLATYVGLCLSKYWIGW